MQKKALSEVLSLCPQQNFTVACTASDITLTGETAITLKTPVRLGVLLQAITAIQTAAQGIATAIVIHNSTLAPLSRTLTFPDLPPLDLTE
ncbi:MAG: hypothetical protein ACK5QX_02825, partial [bacterium]